MPRDDERFTPADDLPADLYDRVAALVDAAEIVEGYTVPWVAGRSPDGARFYPDRDLPKTVTDAKVKTRRSVAFHEFAELIRMDEGETYDKDSDPPGTAHYDANGIEKIEVERQGGDWAEYCKAFRPIIKTVDAEALTDLPPLDDFDLRPYADDDRALLEEIEADAAAEKSARAKISKAAAEYTDGPVDTQPCRACSMFVRPKRCTLVKGAIAPAGHCKHWAAAADKAAAHTWTVTALDAESFRKTLRSNALALAAPTKKDPTMDLKQLFIPITKVDAAQRLVYGLATAEAADKSNEVCDYATTKPFYEKWSGDIAKATDGKSLGNLRVMHGNVAAGKLTAIAFNDDAKQIEICAKVVDDAEWKKVEEGVYTGFSQGGKYVKRWKDEENPALTRYTAEPVEVSLVDVPCLPDATFEVIKADGAREVRKFATVEAPAEFEPAAADVAARAMEIAKSAGHARWHDEIGAARAALVDEHKAAQTATAGQGEASADAAVQPVAKADTQPAGEQYEQVWQSKRDGKTFGKKADLLAHHAALDADAAARKVAGPVLDAVDNLAGLAKKDYSDDERKKMASDGTALKDGSFPIANKDDLKNAIQAYGRAKNKTAAKRHIIKRAKALDATDMLPDGWVKGKPAKSDKAADPEALRKEASLYGVSWLLQLLASVDAAEESAEYDAYGYGGSVNLPNDLKDRFGAALVELGDIAAEMLDLVLAAMKEEEANEAMNRAAPLLDLIKVGARNSKADQDRIAKIHDMTVELGAQCEGKKTQGQSGANDGDADKGAAADDLAKMTAERDAMAKVLADLPARLDAIGKAMEALRAERDEALAKIAADVKTIAEQPAVVPPRAAFVVGKDGTSVPLGAPAAAAGNDLTRVIDDPGVQEAMALALIKRAQQAPQPAFGRHGA